MMLLRGLFAILVWLGSIFSSGGNKGKWRRRKRKAPQGRQTSKRVKKNRYDFGAGSRMGVPIRRALLQCPEKWVDSGISGRLSGLLFRMVLQGSGREGRRRFEVANLDMLNGFPLDEKKPKRAYFCTDDQLLSFDRKRMSVRLSMDWLLLETYFRMKFREYHSLGLGVMALSEMYYEPAEKRYKYCHRDWNAKLAFVQSEPFGELREGMKIELEARLEADGELPEDVGLVGIVGVV